MKTLIYDIETMLEDFLIVFHDVETSEVISFSINKNIDEGLKLIKFIEEHNNYYYVGFNNINFDSQVVEFILRKYREWHHLSRLEICQKIWQFAQDVIDDTNSGKFPPFREEDLYFKQIDLFKIHHFDNENRRTSLKWLEFMMDMESIKDMPTHHDAKNITDQDIEYILQYCIHDVEATYRFYKYTIGDIPDNWAFSEVYKGKNKIQNRLDAIEEFGFPKEAINWSDVRIGDEINLKGYCQSSKLTRKQVYALKYNRQGTKKITYAECIPDYIKFVTPEFNMFYESVRKQRVNYVSFQEFKFEYNDTIYTIAKGGIHSEDGKRKIIVKPHEKLTDADVESQYPNAIIKRQLYPSHLGMNWLKNYKSTTYKRKEYKQKGETNPKFAGLSEQFKLALNGGGYGKTNENTSWQYDPIVTFKCTIGNQFEILMLIEQMEINGIHCVSANTDGILCLYPKELEQKYKEICSEWEKIVGNSEMGKLKFTEYKAFYQTSVNDYIAISADETKPPKKKGSFMTEFEFNKNKSRRIIPLALEAYFKDGINVRTFITQYNNIFDFCIGLKGNRKYHYQAINHDTNEIITLDDRVVRYFISNSRWILIKKKKIEDENGNDITQCEASEPGKKPWFVSFPEIIDKSISISKYNINYEYYIEKAEKIISLIERGKNKYVSPVNPNQISLF